MKTFLLFLLPVILFAQTSDYPDSITTISGKSFPCFISDITSREVSIIYLDNISLTTFYTSVERLFLKDKGLIYVSGTGFIIDFDTLQKFIRTRNNEIKREKEISEPPGSPVQTEEKVKDNSVSENKWSFGVMYVPYSSGKIYNYIENNYSSQLYSYNDIQSFFEGQFSYAIYPGIRLTLDVGYHSTYDKLYYEEHTRSDYSNPTDNGTESETSLKIFDFTLGLKYYFTKFFDQKASAFFIAGAGKQFGFYDERYLILYVEPSPVKQEDNREDFISDMNSPWHLNAGFGAEYSFNKALSLFANIRVLYSTTSADYDYRLIQDGFSRSLKRHLKESNIITRIGMGINFYF